MEPLGLRVSILESFHTSRFPRSRSPALARLLPPANRPGIDVGIRLKRYLNKIDGAYSPRTVRALKSDFGVYVDWCAGHGCSPLPTEPGTVARFVRDRGRHLSIATIRRNLSTIGHLHRALHYSDPTYSEHVFLALRKLRRESHAKPARRRAIRAAEMNAMISRLGRGLTDKRDRALLLTARDTMCRRIELSAMEVSDLRWRAARGGVAVVIGHSKTDPEGHGRTAWASPETARALRAWLDAAGIADGTLFRRVIRNHHVGGRLGPQGIARRFKVMADRAGLDSSRISGHSTRIGMCVDLVAAGFSLVAVQLAGGWKSPSMPAHYARELVPEQGAVAQLYARRKK